MKAAIKRISEGIKPWQVIGTFVSFVVVSAYGVYKFAEAKGYDKAKEDVKEISYEGKIDKLIKADSLKTITLQELITNQGEMISKQEDQKNAYNSLRTVVLDIAKNQKVTLEQMQQYMELTPVLKKKLTSTQ